MKCICNSKRNTQKKGERVQNIVRNISFIFWKKYVQHLNKYIIYFERNSESGERAHFLPLHRVVQSLVDKCEGSVVGAGLHIWRELYKVVHFEKTVQSCQFCRKLYNVVNFVENCAKLSKAQWYFEEECEYFVHNILAKYLGQCTKFDNNITYNLHYKIERRNISNMLKEICSIFWKKYV